MHMDQAGASPLGLVIQGPQYNTDIAQILARATFFLLENTGSSYSHLLNTTTSIMLNVLGHCRQQGKSSGAIQHLPNVPTSTVQYW